MKYVEALWACQPDWRSAVDRAIDYLLPACCVVCRLPAAPSGMCHGCREGLPWSGNACTVCGLPLPGGVPQHCGRCLRRRPPFDGVTSAFWYQFPVRELIRRYKFQRDVAAGGALAALWAERIAGTHPVRPDYVVPVPSHGWRLLRRGFNQAYDLARRVSRDTGLPLLHHDLRRSRHTRQQAGLDAASRRRNLSGAFRWHGQALQGECLALVDDVMTTGATIEACARTLKLAGAGRVEVWVLARAAV